jgi:hypothetical protein
MLGYCVAIGVTIDAAPALPDPVTGSADANVGIASVWTRQVRTGAVAWGRKTIAPSLWGRCSDGKGEFGEARLQPAAGLSIEAEVVVSTAQVLNERMPATDKLGGADAFQAAHRSRSGPQPAVIGFNRVVGVLLHHVPDSGTTSSSTRGYAGARSVVNSLGHRAAFRARAKNRRVAARSRFGEPGRR